MKRRPVVKAEPVVTPDVIAPEIVESARESARENARQSLGLERSARTVKCVVCGDQSSVDATEQLCWVCRRLKISAWRDSDHQLPAQE